MNATTTQDRIHEIETALGTAAASRTNPCGAAAYFDAVAEKPWRIADDSCGESYATFEDALAAAPKWLADYHEATRQDA